ncbi:helix-turn-helix domain-containing protein [Brevibacterium album]|uniref:helix-turn-helix domain-containing protein n=1 Tax=Brevibacterium album TaxID=417948 RepID=UPI00042017FB|nr:GAF domain-containing protein [Brevibacterium album]
MSEPSGGASALLRLLAGHADSTDLGGVEADQADRDSAFSVLRRISDLEDARESLQALVATLTDVSSSTDAEALLWSVVSRARRLLRSDFAYFLALGVDGGLTMHVYDGLLSDLFTQEVIAPGFGISGYIADRRQPTWTSDFLTDERYRHTDHGDRSARSEGIRALAGAPVMAEGQVIGVLLAGERHPRTYSAGDLDLLMSLAGHAAVVHSRNATVFAHENAASARIREAESIVRLQSKLLGHLVDGTGADEMAETLSQGIGGRVVVEDAAGTVVGTSAPQGPDHAPEAQAGALSEAVDLRVREESVGRLRCAVPSGSSEQRMLRELAPTLAIRLALDAGSRRYRRTAEFDQVTAAVRGDTDAESAVLAALGAGEGGPPTVFCIELTSGDRRTAAALLADGLRRKGLTAVAGASGESVVLLAAGSAPVDDLVRGLDRPRMVRRFVLSRGDEHCRSHAEPDVAARTDTALRALQAMRALRWGRRWADADELALFPMVMRSLPPGEIHAFVRAHLGPVIDYDRRCGTALVETLRTRLSSSSNAAGAGAMNVHLNTLRQRLERAQALLTCDCDDAVHLLALNLHQLIEASGLEEES